MGLFQFHNGALVATPEKDAHYEQWVSGTYIVAGVFHRRVDGLTTDGIRDCIPGWFDLLRSRKKAWWPRGICGYYAMPIFTGPAFVTPVVDWVHNRPKHRFAMWHEPVLYNHVANTAETYMNWGLFGRAFRLFVFESILAGLLGLHRQYGHAEFPSVNGNVIDERPNQRVQAGAAKEWAAAMRWTRRLVSDGDGGAQVRR